MYLRHSITIILNYCVTQEKPKKELPEVTDTLVPPPEASAAVPVMDAAKPEDIVKENNEGLTEQEQRLQREEEQFAIYISMLNDEEESDTNTDTDKSTYPLFG